VHHHIFELLTAGDFDPLVPDCGCVSYRPEADDDLLEREAANSGEGSSCVTGKAQENRGRGHSKRQIRG